MVISKNQDQQRTVKSMADEEHSAKRGSSSRRTRSQAAPDWSPVAELVLVNEIAAVESDCPAELSSYQKWKIIAENCAAQDVSHTMSQCRRKWESLLEDYRRVENYESLRSRKASFWSLQSERREKLGLPRTFDRELFAAIDVIVKIRGNQPESEPEEDPEAMGEAETVEGLGPEAVGFAVTSADALLYKHNKGSRKKRQRSKSQGKKRSWTSLAEETFSETSAAEPLQSQEEEEEPPTSEAKKSPIESFINETPPKSPSEEDPRKLPEEKEQTVASILRENAERINAIVAETAGYDCAGDTGGSEDDQNESDDLVRSRGDELIDRLGVLVKTLDQLCNIAQECK